MRKIISLLFMIAIIFIAACKKEQDNNANISAEPVTGQPYTVKNGRVVFKTVAAYRNFLDNLTETQRRNFIAEVSGSGQFSPLNRSVKLLNAVNNAHAPTSRLALTGIDSVDDDIEDMLDSEFLTHLINADGLVQIGDYLFNIDVLNKKCYAMHTYWNSTDSARTIYNWLYNGETSNVYIFEFTTDQDVLDELEALGFPRVKGGPAQGPVPEGLFCREGGRQPQKDQGQETFAKPNEFYRVKCKVNYQKAGIYFALYGKIKQEYNYCKYPGRVATETFGCFWQKGWWRTNFSSFQWRFKPKCWSERVQAPTTEISYTDQERKTRAWESSRALHKFDIQFQWRIDGILCEGQFHTTRIYRIRDGY